MDRSIYTLSDVVDFRNEESRLAAITLVDPAVLELVVCGFDEAIATTELLVDFCAGLFTDVIYRLI